MRHARFNLALLLVLIVSLTRSIALAETAPPTNEIVRGTELFRNVSKPVTYKVDETYEMVEDPNRKRFMMVSAIDLPQAIDPKQVFTKDFKLAMKLTRERLLNGAEPLIQDLETTTGSVAETLYGQTSFDLYTVEGSGFVAERIWIREKVLYHVVMIRFSNATLARDAFDHDFESAMALTKQSKPESAAWKFFGLQIGAAYAGELGTNTGRPRQQGSQSIRRTPQRPVPVSNRPSCESFEIEERYRFKGGSQPKPTEAQLASACGNGALTFLREMRSGLMQMAQAAEQICGPMKLNVPRNPFGARSFKEGFSIFLQNMGQAQEAEAQQNCMGGTMVGMIAVGTAVGLYTSVKNALLASRPLEAVDAIVGSKLDSWPCLNTQGRTQATCDFIARLAATYATGKVTGAFKGAGKAAKVLSDSNIAGAIRSTSGRFARRIVGPREIRVSGGKKFQMPPLSAPNTGALVNFTRRTGRQVDVRTSGGNNLLVDAKTGAPLFRFNYKLRSEPNGEMYVRSIDAEVPQNAAKDGFQDDLKGQGFYSYFMNRMVRENPQVRSIEANLQYDNLARVNALIKQGYSVEEAIRGTPSFRVYSQNGFNRIDTSTINYAARPDGTLSSLTYRVRRP